MDKWICTSVAWLDTLELIAAKYPARLASSSEQRDGIILLRPSASQTCETSTTHILHKNTAKWSRRRRAFLSKNNILRKSPYKVWQSRMRNLEGWLSREEMIMLELSFISFIASSDLSSILAMSQILCSYVLMFISLSYQSITYQKIIISRLIRYKVLTL